MFAVHVGKREDGKYVWTVTYERCGQDLSDHYDEVPRTIVKLRSQLPAIQLENFRRELLAQWRLSAPIVVQDPDGIMDVQQLQAINLQCALVDHAKVCSATRTAP